MKYYLYLLLLFCNPISAQEINQTEFYGKEYFLIEGTIVEDHLKESPYDRLPLFHTKNLLEHLYGIYLSLLLVYLFVFGQTPLILKLNGRS